SDIRERLLWLDQERTGSNSLPMPRKLRLEFPGAMYHIMSRGDQREDIFLGDVDRYDFLKTLAEACRKTDWQVHAFCLMRNHYHLVLWAENHPGQTRLETAGAKADRIVAEELARLQWTQSDLTKRPKSHPAKLALAARLRQ